MYWPPINVETPLYEQRGDGLMGMRNAPVGGRNTFHGWIIPTGG